MWSWHKEKHTDQWIESLEANPCVYSQLIFNKGNSGGKEQAFQQMVLGQLRINMQKSVVGLFSYHIQKLPQNGHRPKHEG